MTNEPGDTGPGFQTPDQKPALIETTSPNQIQTPVPDGVARTEAGLFVPEWAVNALHKAQGIDVPRNGNNLAKLRSAASTLKGPLRKPARSAVLVLLGGSGIGSSRPEDATVVITHRATSLRKHAGQMSFPGGRVDEADHDAVDTALREAWEETGLRRETVTPLGVLDSIDISRTGFAVNPVLAYWNEPHKLAPRDSAEVDSVHVVPISELIDPENRLQVGYAGWQGPAFRVENFIVWGFTAGVLAHLLRTAGWEVPWDHTDVKDLRSTLAASANGESFGMGGKLK